MSRRWSRRRPTPAPTPALIHCVLGQSECSVFASAAVRPPKAVEQPSKTGKRPYDAKENRMSRYQDGGDDASEDRCRHRTQLAFFALHSPILSSATAGRITDPLPIHCPLPAACRLHGSRSLRISSVFICFICGQYSLFFSALYNVFTRIFLHRHFAPLLHICFPPCTCSAIGPFAPSCR